MTLAKTLKTACIGLSLYRIVALKAHSQHNYSRNRSDVLCPSSSLCVPLYACLEWEHCVVQYSARKPPARMAGASCVVQAWLPSPLLHQGADASEVPAQH